MSEGSRQRDRITDEAAVWFVRAQDPDLADEDRKDLASWFAASAEHVREYLQLAALTAELRDLSETPTLDDLIGLAQADGDGHNVVALTNQEPVTAPTGTRRRSAVTRGRSERSRRPPVWAAAASMFIAVAVGAWFYATSGPAVYSTGVGEQVSFPLDDGSVVTLNAQSSLQIAYTDAERNVRLLAGEALFDVEEDTGRPFQVITERAVIRAVGTVFNVRHRGEGTTVTVVEGIVDVRSFGDRSLALPRMPSSNEVNIQSEITPESRPGQSSAHAITAVRLAMGQQARVSGRSGQVAVVATNIEKATSWRQRRLVFESWRLGDVVDEFNLYNDDRILIQDPGLAEILISGAFSADDRRSFVLFLKEAGLAESEIREDGTIVLQATARAH